MKSVIRTGAWRSFTQSPSILFTMLCMKKYMWQFRTELLLTICTAFCVGSLGLPVQAQSTQNSSPNVVVIMGDDWSWPHASCLGDPVVSTPTFDRIATEGVLFENAFVSAPSCTSSRMAFVSGQYQWRLGGANNLGGSLPRDIPVYPDLLAAKGYLTGFSRKGAEPSKHEFRGNDPFGKRYKNFTEFLSARQVNQPFCYWYGAGEPHRPYDWQASKTSKLDLSQIVIPKCLPDGETVRTDLGDYYLRVQKLDQFAGQILKSLESSGQLENTIIIMTGDNGMPFPRCKATLYDLGTRVPLAIRWGKRIKAGRRISDFVSLTDLAPTILMATGIKVPESMTGGSLLTQIDSDQSGRIDETRDRVLMGRERHVYTQPSRGIRTAGYLYIRNFSPASWPNGVIDGPRPHYDFSEMPWPIKPPAFSYDADPSPTKQWMLEYGDEKNVASLNELAFGVRPEEELYDLANDPQQLKNVVDQSAMLKIRNELSSQLTRELHQSGDPKFRLPTHATFQIRGWRVHLNHELWQQKPRLTKEMLGLMAVQLGRVESVVPRKALQQLRRVPIWINPEYAGVRPTAEYHGHAGWLKKNNRDESMAKSIEITNVLNFDFENTRMPFLMLHELAHAYHDQVLSFRNPKIRSAFESARDSGSYDKVRRFTGRSFINDKAYAMSNEKEYFAEATEAYFGKNDFYPFDRSELKSHDPQMLLLLEDLWGVTESPDPE
ncbi:MAG: sulfatase-like hydrolase/transferase [Mariniblastus sp.]|nr:sulfatase-like hydrolase/transferase [Mariniblastus sp.]